MTKFPKKRPREKRQFRFWPDFFEQRPEINSSFPADVFIFLAAEESTFFGGVYIQNWLTSIHPRAYTSMPHPPTAAAAAAAAAAGDSTTRSKTQRRAPNSARPVSHQK
jgi:hypothetical protein